MSISRQDAPRIRSLAGVRRIGAPMLLLLAAGCARSMSTTESDVPLANTGEPVPEDASGSPPGSTARGAILDARSSAPEIVARQRSRMLELAARLGRSASYRLDTLETGLLLTFNAAADLPSETAALGAETTAELRRVARTIRGETGLEVLIVGHTDALGSDSLNEALSLDRSRAAARVLVDEGLHEDGIKTVGRGSFEPLASNQDAVGRALNRRLELAIYGSDVEWDADPGRRRSPGSGSGRRLELESLEPLLHLGGRRVHIDVVTLGDPFRERGAAPVHLIDFELGQAHPTAEDRLLEVTPSSSNVVPLHQSSLGLSVCSARDEAARGPSSSRRIRSCRGETELFDGACTNEPPPRIPVFVISPDSGSLFPSDAEWNSNGA